MIVAGDRFGVNARDQRIGDEVHEINEVTDLANNSPAAFLWIVGPVTARNPSSVNAIIDGQRSGAIVEKLLGGARQRRKAAIEADQQMAGGLLGSGDYRI